MTPTEMPTLSQVTLELERVAVRHGISPEALRVGGDELLDMVVVTLQRNVATWRPDIDEVRVPVSWWDAWKEAHRRSALFHAFVAAHPPRFTTYRARLMLPDFPIPEYPRGHRVLTVPYFDVEAWRLS